MRTEKIFLLRCLGEDLELVFQTRGLPFRYERSRLTGEGTSFPSLSPSTKLGASSP